jgi:hypothetical protein
MLAILCELFWVIELWTGFHVEHCLIMCGGFIFECTVHRLLVVTCCTGLGEDSTPRPRRPDISSGVFDANQKSARMRLDQHFDAWIPQLPQASLNCLPSLSLQGSPSPKASSQRVPSPAKAAGRQEDDARRRLSIGCSILPTGGGMLARRCKKAPKKRSDPVIIIAPRMRLRGKQRPSHVATSPVKKTKGKQRPSHFATSPVKKTKTLSQTRRCYVSRAFHKEGRLCIAAGVPTKEMEARRRAAHKAASDEWALAHGFS